MAAVNVAEPKCFKAGNRWAVSASIKVGADPHEVLFRVTEGPLAIGVEPFLVAAVIPAMKLGYPLRVAGSVSPRLLANLTKVQDIFHSWDKTFHRVPIEAEGMSGASPGPRDVASFFSGGVDSFYTLLRRREEIKKLIFVHGFDIQLDERSLRERVSGTMRQVAAAFNKPLIEVETNLRRFSDRYISWEDYHGAALASVALLLSSQLQRVYIASDRHYAQLLPNGTHPILDPLWSTEQMEIAHDGSGARRIEKLAHIVDDEWVCRTLRVCWENPGGAYNCGRCRKCLLTMARLRAIGALHRVETFDRDLDLVALSNVPHRPTLRYDVEEEILEYVNRLGRDPALARALRACFRKSLIARGRRFAGRILKAVLVPIRRRGA